MGYDLVIGGIRTHLRAKIVPLTRIAQARSDRSLAQRRKTTVACQAPGFRSSPSLAQTVVAAAQQFGSDQGCCGHGVPIVEQSSLTQSRLTAAFVFLLSNNIQK
jgi:hypothetical protein